MIPQFEPWLGEEELALLAECIRDNWITGGKKLKEFEGRMASLVGTKHAMACCNGTQALYLGLKVMGIGEGDEVIVPNFTFIASANSVVWAGAKPVFCDVDRDSFCMGLDSVGELVNEKTKTIMPVGIYGNSPNMSDLMTMADKLLMIEDAAQDIGVTWEGKHLGSFGDVGCMSFYGDKTITSSEGGMVLTDNDAYAEKVVRLLNQGRVSRGRYIHEEMGYNFRLSDLAAAIGLAQLGKLSEIINRKKHHEKLYKELLGNVGQIKFPIIDDRCFNVPFRHNILVDDPEALSKHLGNESIGSLRFFYPLHRQPCYKYLGLEDSHFPNSVWAYEHGLSLPSSVNLPDTKIEYICDKIKEFYGLGNRGGKPCQSKM